MKRLLLESGGICAFPGCNRRLVSPDSSLDSGAVIAELAHIVADSREGPRGKVSLSDAERNGYENFIVLCPEHHKVIDSQPNTFSIQVLRSPRSQQIREYLERTGRSGKEAAEIAAHSTRDRKEIHSPREVMAAHRKLAADFGHQAAKVELEVPQGRLTRTRNSARKA